MNRLAWSGRKEVHSIVPILSGALFGFSHILNTVFPFPSIPSPLPLRPSLSTPLVLINTALPPTLQQRRLHNPLRCLRPRRLNLHTLPHLVLLSSLHRADDWSTGFFVGNEPIGLHYCGYDSDSVGVLEVGAEVEEGDEIFEAFGGC